MKRNIAIILGIIIVVIAVVFWKSNNSSQSSIVGSFTIEEGTFVATSTNATKVEILGVLEGKKRGSGDVNLGQMELVEKNSAGEQTWIMMPPTEKRPYAELYARGYNAENKDAGIRSLSVKGKDAIANAVWPTPKEMTIYGLVRELSGNTLRLSNGGARQTDIVVTLDPTIKLYDTTGKTISRTRLTKNTKIMVTGNFTDELAFKASQIELGTF
jgi:hypothetical protein